LFTEFEYLINPRSMFTRYSYGTDPNMKGSESL
jgi:hypothetical protein